MNLSEPILRLLFPPKCVLCGRLLGKDEQDLCRVCRTEVPEFSGQKKSIPFLAKWTVLWYYEGVVRQSLLRYKFRGRQSYASAYGRLLAMQLLPEKECIDILTWVPISTRRRCRRGFDQVELLARAVGAELGIPPTAVLRKTRHTPPQSSISGPAQRRANVLGAFQVTGDVAGKRILLLDDIITTGATSSECARVLLTAGAKEVSCAALAARHKPKNQ